MTFLDFGLVKYYTPEEVELFEELIRSMVLEHDIAQFRATLEAHGVLRADAPFPDDDVREYFGHFYEFVMDDEVVTLSSEYAAESVRRVFDLSGPYAHVAKASNVPPAFVITQRINLGLHAVLGRLRATRQLPQDRRRAVADRRRTGLDPDGRARSRVAVAPSPRAERRLTAGTSARVAVRGSSDPRAGCRHRSSPV